MMTSHTLRSTLKAHRPLTTLFPTPARSVGTMAGPLLFAFSLPQLWIWMALRQLQGVLDHIGIDCPFDPLHYIPGVGGTVFHDDHHRVFTKNYASCFSVIDDGELSVRVTLRLGPANHGPTAPCTRNAAHNPTAPPHRPDPPY